MLFQDCPNEKKHIQEERSLNILRIFLKYKINLLFSQYNLNVKFQLKLQFFQIRFRIKICFVDQIFY